MSDLVTWNPRVGTTGDDRYAWPSDVPIAAGILFNPQTEPNAVEVNTLNGLNQIIYEVNRRMLLVDASGDKSQQWTMPTDYRFFHIGVGPGTDPSVNPTRQFCHITTTDGSILVSKNKVRMLTALLFNALKLQIWWTEALEGRSHYAFSRPVKENNPPYGSLPGTLIGDPILQQEIFEMRKALATDHIAVFPNSNDLWLAGGILYGQRGEKKSSSCASLAPYPCWDDALLYNDLFSCATVNTFLNTYHGGGGIGANISNWVAVNRSLGGGSYRGERGVWRRISSFHIPGILPVIVAATMKFRYERLIAGGEGEHGGFPTYYTTNEGSFKSSEINIMSISPYAIPLTACVNVWDATHTKLGAFFPTLVPAESSAWVEVFLTNIDPLVATAKVPIYWEFSDVTDQDMIPLPAKPEIGNSVEAFESARTGPFQSLADVMYTNGGRIIEHLRLYMEDQ